MSENPCQLLNIFGKGAIRVEMKGDRGLFSFANDISPLRVTGHNLLINQEMIAGHFQTLPAWRMIEFMGLCFGDEARIQTIENAKFEMMVRPDDILTFSNKLNFESSVNLTRDGKNVASAIIVFSEDGVSPHTAGVLLEIASQTIVANSLPQIKSTEQLYPLITSFGDLIIYKPNIPASVAASSQIIKLEGRRVLASCDIFSRKEKIAALRNVQFQFETAKRIGKLYDLKKNF